VKGGLTYKDLDLMKRKAKVLDDIREWLRGRIDSDKLIAISDMIERAYTEERRP
jgi:hypothetical protein